MLKCSQKHLQQNWISAKLERCSLPPTRYELPLERLSLPSFQKSIALESNSLECFQVAGKFHPVTPWGGCFGFYPREELRIFLPVRTSPPEWLHISFSYLKEFYPMTASCEWLSATTGRASETILEKSGHSYCHHPLAKHVSPIFQSDTTPKGPAEWTCAMNY